MNKLEGTQWTAVVSGDALDLPPVYILHGIHREKGTLGFENLMAPYFRRLGFETVEKNYGHVTAITARWKNPGIAERLADEIPDEAIVVAHSNGCTLAWMLDTMGKKLGGAVLVQPALDRDKILFGPDWVHVYYNRFDRIVTVSRVLRFHPWGGQGHDGPKNPPAYYSVFDTAGTSGMPTARGHSWYVDEGVRSAWGPFMAQCVLDEVDITGNVFV